LLDVIKPMTSFEKYQELASDKVLTKEKLIPGELLGKNKLTGAILPTFVDSTISVKKMSTPPFDHEQLLQLAEMKMPFGKYAGRLLIDLPEPYVVWFAQKGFPGGKLGEMLAIVYEIKVNGLEYLFDPLKNKDR